MDDPLATSNRHGASPPRPGQLDLSESSAERISEWLRAIAEPTRMRLIGILNEGSMSVQALAAQLGASTQNVSRHLMTLHRAGIVGRRKDGTWVHYELVDPDRLALHDLDDGPAQLHVGGGQPAVEREAA